MAKYCTKSLPTSRADKVYLCTLREGHTDPHEWELNTFMGVPANTHKCGCNFVKGIDPTFCVEARMRIFYMSGLVTKPGTGVTVGQQVGRWLAEHLAKNAR